MSANENQAEPSLQAQAGAISRLVVQTTAEFTGRGPTRAQTTLEDDAVFVVLSETMTKGERTLVRDGRGEAVLRMRKEFQRTMRDKLIAGVEAITGRTVVAFLSDNHEDPDVAVEVFILEPRRTGP